MKSLATRLVQKRASSVGLLVFAVSAVLLFQNCSPFTAKSLDVNSVGSSNDPAAPGSLTGDFPILFVTMVPVANGFMNPLNSFGNHGTSIKDSIPGGDLFIRYPSGQLRNLTKEAGFGLASGLVQGKGGIAVRQPMVHWSGKKALFSMLLDGPVGRYQIVDHRWQLYEVTGLGIGEAVKITKVANQPNYNNISPIYGSKDDIFFVSDAPLYNMTHTYPQLDEYESLGTNTGIWKLEPATGKVSMIQHSPSGSFDLFMDSFGRILFTKWDHLKRDQQADLDRFNGQNYGTKDFENENPGALVKAFPQFDAAGKLIADAKGVLYDLFPEALDPRDPTKRADENIFNFNEFFVWQINEDGSEEETLNHIGRHEFGGSYVAPNFNNDPNLTEAGSPYSANLIVRGTVGGDAGMFQLREDPNRPGFYLVTYAKEFSRATSGRIFEFYAPPGKNPEEVVVKDYTNETIDADPYGTAPPKATMTGHYRNPLPLSNGEIVVSHTPEYRLFKLDETDPKKPLPNYVFSLKKLIKNPAGSDWIAGPSLTGGIVKNILWWTDLDSPLQYSGPLSEVDSIEVRPRRVPYGKSMTLADVEKAVLNEEAVNETELRNWLKKKNLALIVSRNVTLRDRADVSQPFNLRVPGGVENIGKAGKVYDVSALQVFQGELTRAYSGVGRRVYSRPLRNNLNHPDLEAFNPAGIGGQFTLGADGSMAAVVPAGRAVTWQLQAPDGQAIVRERVWVTFAQGEIRTCTTCHGLNVSSHGGSGEPQNKPEALRSFLRVWKSDYRNK